MRSFLMTCLACGLGLVMAGCSSGPTAQSENEPAAPQPPPAAPSQVKNEAPAKPPVKPAKPTKPATC